MADQIQLSKMMLIAAAAYQYHEELENPAPDLVMRGETRRRLSVAISGLTTDERRVMSEFPVAEELMENGSHWGRG